MHSFSAQESLYDSLQQFISWPLWLFWARPYELSIPSTAPEIASLPDLLSKFRLLLPVLAFSFFLIIPSTSSISQPTPAYSLVKSSFLVSRAPQIFHFLRMVHREFVLNYCEIFRYIDSACCKHSYCHVQEQTVVQKLVVPDFVILSHSTLLKMLIIRLHLPVWSWLRIDPPRPTGSQE